MKYSKPIILTFVRCYLPGYKSGGPVRTIANLVEHLGDELDFRIITSDRDSMDKVPYSGVCINSWNKVGKAEVYYASPGQRYLWVLAKLINSVPHDVLYLNSFFNPAFTVSLLICRRLSWLQQRPVVVAPRGEFSQGALALKSWKKIPYLATAQALGLCRNITWQASSEHEAADIRRVKGKTAQRIVIASDLPEAIPDARASIKPIQCSDGILRIVFLSRITPMKNLDFALRVLAKVSVPVELHIYGGINDHAYWGNCQQLIHALPPQVTATYHGSVDHELVYDAISGYDLFFLPTRGENYGHVIFEALTAGVPVLISDQTPWRDLDREAVGYVRALNDENAFVEVIERHYRLSVFDRRVQTLNARTYAQKIAADTNLVKQNLELFMNVLQVSG